MGIEWGRLLRALAVHIQLELDEMSSMDFQMDSKGLKSQDISWKSSRENPAEVCDVVGIKEGLKIGYSKHYLSLRKI